MKLKICEGGFATVKKLMHEITPKVEVIAQEVLAVTQDLRLIAHSPTVKAIEDILPGHGAQVTTWIDAALDIIDGVANTGKTLAEKLQAKLDGITEDALDMLMFKTASVATRIGAVESGEPKQSNSLYDSAVQLHVMVNKGKA